MKPLLIIAVVSALVGCSPKGVETSETVAPPVVTPQAIKVPAGAYTLEKTHASLVFRVSHLGFSNYTASFERFDAQLQFDPANLTASSVTATIDPTSLRLINPPPGFTEELLDAQWLDTKQFPEMSYRSTKVEVTAANTLRVTGDLTLRGITRPVVLDVVLNGGYAGHPMDPHARIGFSAQGTFNRSEFGIAYGVPEAGSTMGVSDAVTVIIETEFTGPPLANAAAATASGTPEATP